MIKYTQAERLQILKELLETVESRCGYVFYTIPSCCSSKGLLGDGFLIEFVQSKSPTNNNAVASVGIIEDGRFTGELCGDTDFHKYAIRVIRLFECAYQEYRKEFP